MFMNSKTWSECVKLSINELTHVGIEFVKDDATVRGWSIQFRKTEKFDTPYSRKFVDPKLFSFFQKQNHN